MKRVRTPAVVRALADLAAPHYERDIAPLLGPLAADLARYAASSPADRALDLGTGTGLLARALAPHAQRVTALDLSTRSLAVARRLSPSLHAVAGDLHALPFPAGAFTLVTASFALNAAQPVRALRSIRRVVAPGGRFALQEWGPADPLTLALEDALRHHAVADTEGPLRTLRAQLDALPPAWGDHLQDVDDYVEWLAAAGFAVEDVQEHAPLTVRVPSADAFLAYFLAWAQRAAEIAAMPPDRRAAFDASARAILADAAGPDGALEWAPVLFRVRARAI